MEPSSRQAALPQVLPEFIGRREKVGGGEGRGLLGGALSIRNDRCISSAPGLSLSTLGPAEALQVLKGR